MDLNGTLSGRDFGALEQRLFGNNSLFGNSTFGNSTAASNTEDEDLEVNTDVYSRVIVTVIYAALFAVGSLGNSITLYTLLSRKTLQNLQSTVHYHLASLAVSDLLILVLSMPIELYNFIWFHTRGCLGTRCSYATALNIASLSVERYMAICHPFKAKSIMSRSRTKKLISAMWLASFALATPMIFVMGQVMRKGENICTSIVSPVTIKTVLQVGVISLRVNAFLSFVIPMVVISALNGVIANQLLRMFRRRSKKTDDLYDFYHYFYMLTNILFYVSSAVNPILYNLVSATYRQIFFSTLRYFCVPCRQTPRMHPHPLTRHSISISSNHTPPPTSSKRRRTDWAEKEYTSKNPSTGPL
ncbi:hypothetical protein F7725_000231 [Dissostichus mawsoni]|uniref:G-protein coupled receptors family 1 profile domain-containing protein n=1 Tax=Dissostichus mawsoni TaxID=36200 RepID=A0A7J5ZEB8_DISMA|nr:hypothetical protein F7725_000231 [Dissostichus mawsoni]